MDTFTRLNLTACFQSDFSFHFCIKGDSIVSFPASAFAFCFCDLNVAKKKEIHMNVSQQRDSLIPEQKSDFYQLKD